MHSKLAEVRSSEIRNQQPELNQVLSESTEVEYHLETCLENYEKEMIQRVLKKTNNNKKAASQILGISRQTLHKKIKKYSL
ncbi:MAG: helix-turn-helix domain-containing protein [Thermodesulfobacteriota bacterium]|nr:helix-turn-helix domain-containing protein [Thermodesulfobacteriota bacterium]